MSGEAEPWSLDADSAVRDVRSRIRSRQLLEAAARLMAREGADAVSMQAVATEAGVSVGLIYRYFGGKGDLLLAVICSVLDAFDEAVPAAVERAGSDPIQQLAAAFRAYCEVIDAHRHAAVLTYREGKSLKADGREKIKKREIETSEPLRVIIEAAAAGGLMRPVDTDLVVNNLLLLAHGWALKHWNLGRTLDFDDYVTRQTALTLDGLLAPRRRRAYINLVEPDGSPRSHQ